MTATLIALAAEVVFLAALVGYAVAIRRGLARLLERTERWTTPH